METDANDKSTNSVNSFFPLKRIVSLVPSQTELLFHLGLDEEVIGITKFCVHPEKWFREKKRVGGTKTVKIDVVKLLKPDLIIANEEENVKEQVEELQQIAHVWASDIKTLDDALSMIIYVGKLVNKQDRAGKLVKQIEEAFKGLIPLHDNINAAYLIWKEPFMAAGANTFIHDMLNKCGFKNVFGDINRYPEIAICNGTLTARSLPAISQRDCRLVLLSSEPYPFKQKHVAELQALLPFTKIILVDGEIFSWYGSRLLLAPQYFNNLIRQLQE